MTLPLLRCAIPSPEHSALDLAPLLSQRLRTLMRHHGRFLNQDVERSSSDQFATASANLLSTTPANASPAQAAAQSNPHRPRTAHQPPRVPSSEAFGRRPSPRLYKSTTGRHPKPFTKAVAGTRVDLRNPKLEWRADPPLYRGLRERCQTEAAWMPVLSRIRASHGGLN